MTPNYNIIRSAAINGRQITFNYNGYPREACPHVVGRKNGLEKLLFFQFGGQSSKGLPEGGEWRCAFVSEIFDLKVHDGPWFSRDSHKRPQTCVDFIDVEVRSSDDGHYTPYINAAYS